MFKVFYNLYTHTHIHTHTCARKISIIRGDKTIVERELTLIVTLLSRIDDHLQMTIRVKTCTFEVPVDVGSQIARPIFSFHLVSLVGVSRREDRGETISRSRCLRTHIGDCVSTSRERELMRGRESNKRPKANETAGLVRAAVTRVQSITKMAVRAPAVKRSRRI